MATASKDSIENLCVAGHSQAFDQGCILIDSPITERLQWSCADAAGPTQHVHSRFLASVRRPVKLGRVGADLLLSVLRSICTGTAS